MEYNLHVLHGDENAKETAYSKKRKYPTLWNSHTSFRIYSWAKFFSIHPFGRTKFPLQEREFSKGLFFLSRRL